jgi:drug/metabolite transporter (DMT)-like permease
MPAVPSAGRHAVALVLAAASWGIGAVVSKQAVAEIPPLTLLPLQLAVSAGFLVLVGLRRGERPVLRGPRSRVARLGVLNPGLGYALSLLGLVSITASLSVLLWALEPVLILFLAVLVLRERPGTVLVLLSAAAVLGLGLVLYDPSAAGSLPGVALTVAGIACCAVYTVATRRWLPGADSTLGVVAAQQLYALGFAVVLLAVAAVAGVAVLPGSVSAGGAVSVVVSGLLYYGLAYSLYLSALRAVPASVAAVSFYLIPVFGVGAGAVAGDRLGAGQWLGAAIVVGAVALISIRTAAAPAIPEAPGRPASG